MTKYYFISYIGIRNNGSTVAGCTVFKATDMSLLEICEIISFRNDFKKPCVITSLKDLSEKEFKMLDKRKRDE